MNSIRQLVYIMNEIS